MKKILIITGILFMIFSIELIAQDSKADKKAAKKARKEAREKEKAAALARYVDLANSKEWAIQAEMIYDEKNNTFTLNPSMNFILLDNEELTFQLVLQDLYGWTGSKGSTDLGQVSEYEVSLSKSVKINMTGKGAQMGTVKFNITIDSSGMARAYLSGIGSDRLTISGLIVPLAQAEVFKDTTNY